MGMKLVNPGGTYWGYFATSDGTSLVAADSLPSGVVTRNLSDDGAVSVAITAISTGWYGYAFTVPIGYAVGDRIGVRIAYAVNGQFGVYVDGGQLTTQTDNDAVTSVTGNVGGISGITFPSVVGDATATSQAAIKAKTDLIGTNSADSPNAVTAQGAISTNLDAAVSSRSTLAAGAQMDLVIAPNATAISAIQSGLATATGVNTVGTNVSAVKAKTDLIATNSADSPNAVASQNTINTKLDATVSSRSTFAGGAVASVTSPVSLNLSQTVPTSNTAQTVGDALNAARAQGFGKWVLSGTTLTLYAPNGTTVVRTFTLDSATAPTSRT